jgi:hypothetical protein
VKLPLLLPLICKAVFEKSACGVTTGSAPGVLLQASKSINNPDIINLYTRMFKTSLLYEE